MSSVTNADRHDPSATDERSPLLSDHLNDFAPNESGAKLKAVATPVPKIQLTVICAARLAAPIAFTQIFPYINEYLNYLHVTDDPKRIGLYSGAVESIFALFQLSSLFFLARLSDRIGRRPVMIFCTLGTAISSIFLGLSKKFAMVVAFRATGGFTSGTAAVIHSAVTELSDISNQAVILPIYGLAWPVGSILGPFIGGALSRPAEKYPMLDWNFLREYPYFLPCFVTGLICMLGALSTQLFMGETLPSKRFEGLSKASSQNPSSEAHSEFPGPSQHHTVKQLLARPGIRALCSSGFVLSFLSTGFDVLFVLYCYSAVENGGLAFPASKIGYALSGSGALALLIQLMIMPYLLQTFDLAKLYNSCMCIWPCVFICLSFLNRIAQSGYDPKSGVINDRTITILWVCIAGILAMVRVGNLCYTFSIMLAKVHTPGPSSLGACNGLIQSSYVFARAISPVLLSTLFALSVDKNLLGGYLWVIITVAISLGGIYESLSIGRAGIQM